VETGNRSEPNLTILNREAGLGSNIEQNVGKFGHHCLNCNAHILARGYRLKREDDPLELFKPVLF
jgi:hypothetical protein